MPWKPTYSRDEAVAALGGAETWKEALEYLGLGYHGKTIGTLRKWAEKWSIPTDHLTDVRGSRPPRNRYSEQEARDAIANSMSWVEALRKLGMCHSGGNWLLLQQRALDWNISADHFDPYARGREAAKKRRLTLDEILVENSDYSRGHLKTRLYEAGLKERKCELCGQAEIWRGKPIGMILDHINGIRNDNRLENLQIVCPNCAAGLDTHCGRKNRIDISDRECVRCGESFRPRSGKQRYCSSACGTRSPGKRTPKPETRKCERPPLQQLLQEIDEVGYLATGRKYGVSDNAVRKWVRTMLHEEGISEEIPKRTWPNRRR